MVENSQLDQFRDILKRLGRSRLLGFALALVSFGLFLKLTFEITEDSKVGFLDRGILTWVGAHRVPSMNGIAVDITALGSPTIIVIGTLVGVILLLLSRNRWGAVYLAVGSAGAGIGTWSLKHLFSRDRPTLIPHLIDVSGSSYPSGHSFGATAFYSLLMFISWRHFQSARSRSVLFALTSVIIGLVAISRIYLGVHFPSDVLSGVLLGSAWTCALTALFAKSGLSDA